MDKCLGYVFLVIALILESLKPIFIKYGFNDFSISSLSMMGILAVMTGILSFVINRPKLPIEGKDFGSLLLLSFLMLCYTLANVIALKYLNIIKVTAIIALTPLVITIHQAFRIDKKLSKYFYLGFLIAFSGVLLVINLTDINKLSLNYIGVMFSFLTVITAYIYRIKVEEIFKKLKNISSGKLSCYMLIICGFMCLIFLPIDFKNVIKQSSLTFWTVLFSSSICWIYANKFFVKSIKMIGATYGSMLWILQPAIVMGLAPVILKEQIYSQQVLGISILILGILISEITNIYKQKNLKPQKHLSSKIKKENEKILFTSNNR